MRSGRGDAILSEMEAPDLVRVVYVEDDERLARLTMKYLASHGIETTLVTRGDLAAAEIARARPDVVVLDLMLPGASGLEVCKKVRERLDVPIILVTARTEEDDRVGGLDGGADDYVTKPFSSRELVARIRAHARRARGRVGPRRERIAIGELVIDAGARTATFAGKPLVLTTFEFALLHALAERAGRSVDREQLLELLHGTSEDAFDRSIDVHVSRLRHKLGDDPRSPRLLKTIRGAGYMLCQTEPAGR